MSTKRVAVLVFPQVQALDVFGPIEVFSAADRLSGGGRYAVEVLASRASMVATSSGVRLAPDRACSAVRAPLDTLIVAGGDGVRSAIEDRALVRFLARMAPRARRVCSVCTGAFLLAEAGLLCGRHATTHWSACAALAERHPDVLVEPDPIFIRDGKIATSAGVTAGMDLALALVEEDLGRDAALAIARQLVVFLKRPGGQAQFSAALALQTAEDKFGALHNWINDHLAGELSLSVLAEQAGMSERSFSRHYAEATGQTPARAIERLRVEAARHMLSESRVAIKRVAQRCGFGSEETMRRSFLRLVAVTPQDYRSRFTI